MRLGEKEHAQPVRVRRSQRTYVGDKQKRTMLCFFLAIGTVAVGTTRMVLGEWKSEKKTTVVASRIFCLFAGVTTS